MLVLAPGHANDAIAFRSSDFVRTDAYDNPDHHGHPFACDRASLSCPSLESRGRVPVHPSVHWVAPEFLLLVEVVVCTARLGPPTVPVSRGTHRGSFCPRERNGRLLRTRCWDRSACPWRLVLESCHRSCLHTDQFSCAKLFAADRLTRSRNFRPSPGTPSDVGQVASVAAYLLLTKSSDCVLVSRLHPSENISKIHRSAICCHACEVVFHSIGMKRCFAFRGVTEVILWPQGRINQCGSFSGCSGRLEP